jgi:hypothetical protein
LKWQDVSVDIACSLSPAALESRRERWRRLLADSGLGHDQTPDGLRLRFRPDAGVAAALDELAAAERECCRWADWSVEAGAGELALVVRAAGDGVPALHAMFTETGV